jgi:lipopolysaccharide export system protein LptA
MAFDPKRLRRFFAAGGVLLLVVVLGFYSYARYRVNQAIKNIPERLGVDVEQQHKGFTFTKSEGGRKQFSISARNAVQFRQGQRASLEGVRIVVYGRGTPGTGSENRYDQIYGKRFEYDQQAGEVRASGDVMIDLERRGTPSPDPLDDAPQPGSIHLKTSGLTFNQQTGIAQTAERIEFSLPQARGSAVGAIYDSAQRTLTLKSQVRVQAAAEASRHSSVNMNAAIITAGQAVITDTPRRIELARVHLEQQERALDAQHVRIFLRDDSTVERALASGDVQASQTAPSGDRSTVTSEQADFTFGSANALQEVVLTGGTKFETVGKQPASGTAGKVTLRFGDRNRVAGVRATENVMFRQGDSQQTFDIQAPAIDFTMAPRGGLASALTHGSSQIAITQPGGGMDPSVTTITADTFEAKFAAGNRISSVHGEPNAKIAFSSGTSRTATSREITAIFNPRSARNGELQSVDQAGGFAYTEGARSAFSEHARYLPAEDVITLTGSPRIQDKQAGLAVTANTLRLNRRTGEASAEGDVKTTYSDLKPTNGAMLAGADPVHVTSASAQASRGGRARFTRGARLWQGANIVQAPTIEFDRDRRWLQATTPAGEVAKVSTVFAQTDKSGKVTPVNVRAQRLTYSDLERRAKFEGGVMVTTTDTKVTAAQIEILLLPRQKNTATTGPTQLQEMIATGNLEIEQQSPSRKATGDRLVYTANDGKFVLTGSKSKSPSIFDAERGEIAGDSLTFFSRDGRVQVGSGENSRTVTRTRIKDETRP